MWNSRAAVLQATEYTFTTTTPLSGSSLHPIIPIIPHSLLQFVVMLWSESASVLWVYNLKEWNVTFFCQVRIKKRKLTLIYKKWPFTPTCIYNLSLLPLNNRSIQPHVFPFLRIQTTPIADEIINTKQGVKINNLLCTVILSFHLETALVMGFMTQNYCISTN